MKRPTADRRALTLLELVLAASMLSVLMLSVGVVLRGGRQAWEAHSGDFVQLNALHATVRHIVRQVRQASSVSEITAASNTAGRMGLNMSDGSVVVWSRDSTTNKVNYGVTTPSSLLAENISSLKFTGYKADGVTTTTTPSDIQLLLIEASTTLSRETNATKTVQSWAWLRSWQ
jgi:type II secretory pathway component PulJ